MAERFRQVHPDEILTLRDGRELAVVSEEHFVNEVAKIASFIAFAGGTMSAVVYRQPTDLKGEMATVGAVLSWADRTDARPQPEPASAPPEHNYGADIALETPAAEPVSRDGGNGAGALPFQAQAQMVEIGEVEVIEGLQRRTQPAFTAPPQPDERAYRAAANAERELEIEAERSRAMTDDGEPVLPRPAHDDDVDDGLSGVGGEDLSEIPEHLRG
jgi:hypothetical protein